MKNQSGQTALIVIFLLGLFSLLIGITLAASSAASSLSSHSVADSAAAFYMADSGISEALYRISHVPHYGNAAPESVTLPISTGVVTFTVSGDDNQKTITSLAAFGQLVKSITAVAVNTSSSPGFGHAVHGGLGGVTLENNTLITGKSGVPGNIYSNSSVWGAKNDYVVSTGVCKNSASAVTGSVWAVDSIVRNRPTDSGLCISQKAFAAHLSDCFVRGDLSSPSAPSAACPFNGLFNIAPVPTPVPLPSMGITTLKNHLTAHGKVHHGDCILDGSGSVSDCSAGTDDIGNLIITGNLVKPSNRIITVSGPVWVHGNVIFNSQGAVNLSSAVTTMSQILVADGTIQSDSNVSYGNNGIAFLLFLSTQTPTTPDSCDAPAISISSNANSVLFYATRGCVQINANSAFHGAILGEKIIIRANSTVEYDPALASAIFGLSENGGWQISEYIQH